MAPEEPLEQEDEPIVVQNQLHPAPFTSAGLTILEPDPEEDLDDDLDEEPLTVLITGACGNIGEKLRSEWADFYDLVLLDSAPAASESEVIQVDLSELEDEWLTYFHGVDTVVHLAANPDESATWEELERPNLDVLANVLHAAALAGVERFVFASSNHVMGGYRELDMRITADLPPRPDSAYGASKLVGERLGRSVSRAFNMTFIALRLGSVQPGENRPDTLPDDWARSMWLSNRDLIRLFEAAVEAELEDIDFVVVNGMSNNRGSRWDLDATAELLEFDPEDDAYNEEL